MSASWFRRGFCGLILALWSMPGAWGRIMVGDNAPVQGHNWPAGAETLANLPTRFSYWEGPPFGGGQSHFNYAGQSTADFQAALDAFARIEAPRLVVKAIDGATTAAHAPESRPLHWEFEIWDREAFARLNTPGEKITMSGSPWYGRPLPPPLLKVYLNPQNPVRWDEVRLPGNVEVVDCRVDSSPFADSKGGVIRVIVRDMATDAPIAGAQIEVGQYNDRNFEKRYEATTDQAGEAVIRDLPVQTYVVRAQRDGYVPRMLGYHRNFGRTLTTIDDAKLAPRHALAGVVVDATGRPIPGVEVGVGDLVGTDNLGYEMHLHNERAKSQTDAQGRFVLDPLPDGRVSLRLRKPGYHYFSFQTYPIPGSEPRVTMDVTGMIRGNLIGMDKIKLPEGYRFYVELQPVGDPIGKWSGEKQVEDGGSFAFEGIPAETYRLVPFVAKPERGGYSRSDKDPQFAGKEVILMQGEPASIVIDVSLGN